MSATSNATDHTLNSTKSVDASLWWDSFTDLLTELEDVSLSADLPPYLVKKLEDNHAWFLDTVSLFKPPNQKSREALDASQINFGSHKLLIDRELKETALRVSSILFLDEVQSYILVKRSTERHSLAVDSMVHELFHMVMLQYYVERQCLLKCIRQILMHALYIGSGSKEQYVLREEAEKLISDGLETRLLDVLQELLSSNYPEHMDVDFFVLWAEETLIEDNLILDILFLVYYESLCACNGSQWKKFCLLYQGFISGSYNFEKLAISTQSVYSIYCAKVQLLLILIETLDLENILQMLHDAIPFRQGSIAFSLIDIQEMDAIVSSISAFEMKEAGPLILAWAVFICLVMSLSDREENIVLLEINHVGYVRQAFESASLSYFLEILQSSLLKDSDGPIAGYRCVLRTFISAFIASYEISLQLEDNNFKSILDILCQIYEGEESLCIQFWDKDSFIDGPVRCLLCNLEGEFPFRTVELVRLLSALCEGSWPAECVYNFLCKSVGLSTLFEITGDSIMDAASRIVETRLPLYVPGYEGLLIPEKTQGHVLKVIDGNTLLVRWEYKLSALLVLLLRMAQSFYLDNTQEIHTILDLLNRLVTFNTAVCYSILDAGNSLDDKADTMNEHTKKYMGFNTVEVICTLLKNLPPTCIGTATMSMGVNILVKMLNCFPSDVSTMVLKARIFDVALRTDAFDFGSNGLSGGSWLLSGRLVKMLHIDCEHSNSCCQLTLSVLDFTMQLVATGIQNDVVLDLVIFSLQYILVNHEFWKYKLKHTRWKVTVKVLEVVKKCILMSSYYQKLGEVVRGVLLSNSYIHNTLFRIVSVTSQGLEKLYVSRLYELVDIEGLQLAISYTLEILFRMLLDLSKDILPSVSVFHQAILSSATKPIPVVTAVISLMSCFRNPTIQISAARLLSMLFVISDCLQPHVSGNACFGLADKQLAEFRNSVNRILCELSPRNEDRIVATFKLLTFAASYQPAFLAAVIALKDNTIAALNNTEDLKLVNDAIIGSDEANILDTVLQYIKRSQDLIKSNPKMLSSVLNFLKALWQGAAHFTNILECLGNSKHFWRQISDSTLLMAGMENEESENMSKVEVANLTYRYQCQTDVLQIVAYEIFIQRRLLHAELLLKQSSEVEKKGNASDKANDSSLRFLNDVLSTWCEESFWGNMIKSYASCEYNYEIYHREKVTASLFVVDVMIKLKTGIKGSLSVSLIEKICMLSQKLSNLPAFSELSALYSERGYSEGKELHHLILSDLYFHLQGELEGRKIDHKQFKELSQYLLESKFLQSYQNKYDDVLLANAKDMHLFDSMRLQADMGLDTWDHSEWKASKGVAESMLLYLKDVNAMVLRASSKLSALKSLAVILSMCYDGPMEKNVTIGGKIPAQLIFSCIDHVCKYIHSTIESLIPFPDGSEDILDFLAAQVELLLHLIRSLETKLSMPTSILILRTSFTSLKMLNDLRPLVAGARRAIKILLMLIVVTQNETVEAIAEASNVSLGLLPILCNCLEPADHFNLALSCIDLILKDFSTPATWFPLIQKHLQLHYVVTKLQDKNSSASVPTILKFLLTLATVRGGADMLLNAGFFTSLKLLYVDLSNSSTFSAVQNDMGLSSSADKLEKPRHIWGLGLAVVTAMIHSFGDSSLCPEVLDNIIPYLFLEKAHIIAYYLSAPEFPSDDHDKKRARVHKRHTSLSALTETENTLMLLCVLAKLQHPCIKSMKEMDSQLRERIIHFLAFISRATQRLGESSSMVAPLSCHPVLKEEFDWYKKPSSINSRNGWFAVAPLACRLNPKFSNLLSRTSYLIIKDQSTENTIVPQTYFSDVTAIQIYRIAFLLLKFLCLQAEGASRRAEEVGFVDMAHFPELPMPDILHCLQDQGIAIVTELCESKRLKQVPSDIQDVCILLLQVAVMALYLEYCVSQICGIRPVLGRIEDFSNEIKLLMSVTEGHPFLKEPVKSIMQIISFLYPGLLD